MQVCGDKKEIIKEKGGGGGGGGGGRSHNTEHRYSRKTWVYGKKKGWAIKNNIQLSTPNWEKRNSNPASTKGMLTTNRKNKTKYKIRDQEMKINLKKNSSLLCLKQNEGKDSIWTKQHRTNYYNYFT